MRPRSILIIGNYGAGNLGDDSILGGILTDLSTIGFTGKIFVTHGGINSSPDIYKGLKKVPFVPVGIRSRFKKNSQEILNTIKSVDLVILGGGGLFTDEESRLAPIIWAKQVKFCKRFKTPYICYGQSIGPLHTWLGRRLTKTVFKGAKAVHVRDQKSASELRALGIKHITVGTDLAFSWLSTLVQKQAKREDVLLISMRLWKNFSAEEWGPYLEEIKALAKKKKLKPILLAMDTANKKEIKAFKETELEIFQPQSAKQAVFGMQKAKMAVTMRLHAGIMALSTKTPLFAISYSQKVASLLANPSVKTSKNQDFLARTFEDL